MTRLNYLLLIILLPVLTNCNEHNTELIGKKPIPLISSDVDSLRVFELLDEKEDPKATIQFAEKAVQYADSVGRDDWAIEAYELIGNTYFNTGDFDSAVVVFNKQLELHVEQGDVEGEMLKRSVLAVIYSILGNVDSCFVHLNEVNTHRHKIQSFHTNVTVQGNITSAYLNFELYDLALKVQPETVRLLESSNQDKERLSDAYLKLGAIYDQAKYFDEAEDYFNKALELARDLDYNLGVIYSLVYLSELVLDSNPNEAIHLLKEGRAYVDTRIAHHRLEYTIANSLFSIGQIKEAKTIVKELVESRKDVGSVSLEQEQELLLLAKCMFEEGSFIKAQTILEQVVSRSSDQGVGMYLEAKETLSEVYFALGKNEAAYEQLKNYSSGRLEYEDQMSFNSMQARISAFALSEKNAQIEQQKVKIKNRNELLKLTNANLEKERAFWLVVAIAMLLFILFIYRGYKVRLNRQELERSNFLKEQQLREKTIQNKLIKVQLQALRSQVNPHFIFNAVQAIQGLILTDKKERACRKLINFAHLTRTMMVTSDMDFMSLKKEAELNTNYLVLQSLRLPDTYTYDVRISEDVDPLGTFVVTMVINPYLEAILENVQNKSNMIIELDFYNDDGFLICEIRGTGMKKEMSKEDFMQKPSISNSMQRVELLVGVSHRDNVLCEINHNETSAEVNFKITMGKVKLNSALSVA